MESTSRGTGALLVASIISSVVGAVLVAVGISMSQGYGSDGTGLIVFGWLAVFAGFVCGVIATKHIGDTIDAVHQAFTPSVGSGAHAAPTKPVDDGSAVGQE